MNELVVKQDSSLAAITGALGVADYYFGLIDMIRGQPRLEVMPTKEERQAITDATQQLNAKLRGIDLAMADKDRARQIFGALYTGYARLPDTADNLVTACMLHLAKIPIFAISEACTEIRAGSKRCDELGIKPGWPPGAFQVFQLAEQIVAPYSEQWARMRKVLDAKQVTYRVSDDEREKVGTLLADLANKLRAPESARELERRKRVAEFSAKGDVKFKLREYQAKGIEPYKNSDGVIIALDFCLRLGMVVAEDEATGRKFLVKPKAGRASENEQADQGMSA